jgi:hypothetical protein
MVIIRAARLEDISGFFTLVRLCPTPAPPDYDAFSSSLQAKLPDRIYLVVADHQGTLVSYLSGDCHPTFYTGERRLGSMNRAIAYDISPERSACGGNGYPSQLVDI